MTDVTDAVKNSTLIDASHWQVPNFDIVEIRSKDARYACTIPVLNENKRIANQLKRMQPYLADVDIIILDGGSTDGGTNPDKMKGFGVRAVLTKTGPGKMSAQMRMGFSWALQQGYEAIINIDGNDKDGVESIPRYIELLKEGFDCVLGSRFLAGGFHENTPVDRHLAVKYIHAPLISLGAGFRYTDSTNSFRAYKRGYLLDPRVQPFRNIFSVYNLPYYLAVRAPRLGFKVIEVPVRRVYPANGMTPTKINGFRARWGIMVEIWKTITGGYNPK